LILAFIYDGAANRRRIETMSRKKSENFYTVDHANKFADRGRSNGNRVKRRQIKGQLDLPAEASANVCNDPERSDKST